MKISIYYMHYNTQFEAERARDPQKTRPGWFSYEISFKNLIRTLNIADNWEIELCIWYDGKIDDGLQFIKRCEVVTKPHIDFKIFSKEFGSQKASNTAMIPFILGREYSDSDLIYILENDYLHTFDWLFHLENLIKSNIHFTSITLADHPDNYLRSSLSTFIFKSPSHLWKTTIFSAWSHICHYKIFKYQSNCLIRYEDRAYFANHYALGGLTLAPIPALSTHAMTGQLSPVINWEHIARDSQ